jgi:hypothetical protein
MMDPFLGLGICIIILGVAVGIALGRTARLG